MAKKIDHVLVYGQWRMIQNCRVYRSAQFLNPNHMLKSKRIVQSQPRLDVGKLKDERVAEEFSNRLSGYFGVWVFWGILKSCGVPSRSLSLMLLVDVLEHTEGRRRI